MKGSGAGPFDRTGWCGAVALLSVLGALSPARATCPTFDIERTKLGFLGLAHQRQITPADREAIMKGGVIPGVPVGVWPPRGPAPLKVGLIWLLAPEDPLAIEFDADGDGVPEIVDTGIENFGHTYTKPGNYPATVRVRDQQGAVTTYASPVTVLTPAAFEAELQARWASFKAALRRKDLDAAIECLHSVLRNRLESDIRGFLGKDVERLLPPIRFVEVHVIDARFAGTRSVPGKPVSFDVHFAMDEDGVWRLASFGDIGDRP